MFLTTDTQVIGPVVSVTHDPFTLWVFTTVGYDPSAVYWITDLDTAQVYRPVGTPVVTANSTAWKLVYPGVDTQDHQDSSWNRVITRLYRNRRRIPQDTGETAGPRLRAQVPNPYRTRYQQDIEDWS